MYYLRAYATAMNAFLIHKKIALLRIFILIVVHYALKIFATFAQILPPLLPMATKKKHSIKHVIFATVLWGSIGAVVVGGAVLIALVATGYFGELPSFAELENPKSNIATEIYSADQKLIGTYFIENRSFLDFNDISPHLVRAVLATEDARFPYHSGIDMQGLLRVAVRTLMLGDRRQGGGSTITQQLAKNLFPREPYANLNPFAKAKKIVIFKLKEWVTAVKLERAYTKNEILAMYLNVVFYGHNAYGIRSAAKTFFNKAPLQLNVEEAALLAGVINAPTRYSPVRNPDNALHRRNSVLRRMEKSDYFDEDTYYKLAARPIKLTYQQDDHNAGIATYFRERVRQIMLAKKPVENRFYLKEDYENELREWNDNPLYGWCQKNKKLDGSSYDIHRDGLKIYTTINSRMQQYAEFAVEEHLKKSLQPTLDREIKWKGGRIWGKDISKAQEKELILRAIKQTERYRLLRQDGASEDEILKAFNTPVNMTIFTWNGEKDVTMSPLDSILYYKSLIRASFMTMDPHTGHVNAYVGGPNFRYFKYDCVSQSKRQIGSTIKPFLYTLAMQEGKTPCDLAPNVPQVFDVGDSVWSPRNAAPTSKDGQMVTLKWGLALSVNNISAWITKQFNPHSIAEVAHKMGIRSYIPPYASIFLGTAETSLYELVNAYATFANSGIRVHPIMVTRIEDRNGNVLARFENTEKYEAISEQTAYLMTNLLQYVVDHGTAIRIRYTYELKGAIGGKTGTTQNQADGWFAAITPSIAAGAWVGCDDNKVHFETLATGGGSASALPIFGLFWQKVMQDPSLPYYRDGGFKAPVNMRRISLDCDSPSDKSQSKQKGKRVVDEFF
jgi:penicillin-binding protein 1A